MPIYFAVSSVLWPFFVYFVYWPLLLLFLSSCHLKYVQWNPFTPDTIGATVSVLISGVSLFQGLILYTFVAKPSVQI